MCDFKPGDEVVRYRKIVLEGPHSLPIGTIATIVGVSIEWGRVGLFFEGLKAGALGHLADEWRKVERKNDSLSIEAFLTIKSGQFEGPRRPTAPAKKREPA